jgi:chromosome segregation ATPase
MMHQDPLTRVACSLEELVRIYSQDLASRRQLDRIESTLDAVLQTQQIIMSAISDFAAKQNAFNDRIDTAIEGLTADVKSLNDLIEKLQNTQGAITAEDQALLNQIETRSDAVAAKLEALDALNPPPPPVA